MASENHCHTAVSSLGDRAATAALTINGTPHHGGQGGRTAYDEGGATECWLRRYYHTGYIFPVSTPSTLRR